MEDQPAGLMPETPSDEQQGAQPERDTQKERPPRRRIPLSNLQIIMIVLIAIGRRADEDQRAA
jgi:hypothetical protein